MINIIWGIKMKEQFFPRWYIQKKLKNEKEQLKKLIILFGLFLLVSLVNIYKMVLDFKEVSIKDDIVGNIDDNRWESLKFYHQYNYLYEIFKTEEINLKKLEILNDYFDVEIYVDDTNDYKSKINILENRFILKEISPLIYEENKAYFKVGMNMYEN